MFLTLYLWRIWLNFYIKLISETIAAMNNVVETPFVILFFVLCEVGKP